jgi:hypothetical protein
MTLDLPLNKGLREATRLGWLVSDDERTRLAEVASLVACGVVAAIASQWLDFHLRIPGHAILRIVFPMALGLALVPRRGAGTIMGASGLLSGLALRAVPFAGGGLSIGALTSLTLTGPLLDLSLRRAKGGWRLYAGFALAGLASNAAALLARGGAKLAGLERLGTRPFMEWLPQAAVSYLLCGLAAGVLSGLIWFHGRHKLSPAGEESAP